MTLLDEIVAEIDRTGPIPFSRYMELALYHPTRGLYAGAHASGQWGPTIKVPTPDQSEQLATLDAEIADLQTVRDETLTISRSDAQCPETLPEFCPG